jgi:hypothetical protein
MVAIQSAFHLKIHQNKFFYFLKIIFNIITLKRFKNKKKNFILNKTPTKHSYFLPFLKTTAFRFQDFGP